MKQITIGIIIGVVLTGLFSFQKGESFFTIKPALPKSTLVKEFNTYPSSTHLITLFIREQIERGYIFKSITRVSGSQSDSGVILIMEKY